MVDVPFTELSPAALRGLIEHFVMREGTDYGHTEYSLDEKVDMVRRQLEQGKAKIIYDEQDQTFDIVRV